MAHIVAAGYSAVSQLSQISHSLTVFKICFPAVCFQLLIRIFKTVPIFCKTLHTNPRIAHKNAKRLSYLAK